METNKKRDMMPEEQLIVAADFTPDLKKGEGRNWARRRVLLLADELSETGVYLKLESNLRGDYNLIHEVHNRNLGVMADLKLVGIPSTLSRDGAFLREFQPEIVTAMCIGTQADALAALKAQLPETEVLGVTALTSLEEGHVPSSIREVVMMAAHLASRAGLDGLVSAATEATMLRRVFRDTLTINTPNIRPAGVIVEGDDQNPERMMTPTEAIKAGATRVIIGRPFTRAAKPYDVVMHVIDEIAAAKESLTAA